MVLSAAACVDVTCRGMLHEPYDSILS